MLATFLTYVWNGAPNLISMSHLFNLHVAEMMAQVNHFSHIRTHLVFKRTTVHVEFQLGWCFHMYLNSDDSQSVCLRMSQLDVARLETDVAREMGLKSLNSVCLKWSSSHTSMCDKFCNASRCKPATATDNDCLSTTVLLEHDAADCRRLRYRVYSDLGGGI